MKHIADELLEMADTIKALRRDAEKLVGQAKHAGIPAAQMNAQRILACIEMLELNFVDPIELIDEEHQTPSGR